MGRPQGVTNQVWVRANWGEIFTSGRTINVRCRGWTEFQIKFSRDDVLEPLLNERNSIIKTKAKDKTITEKVAAKLKSYLKEHPEDKTNMEKYNALKEQYGEELALAALKESGGLKEIEAKIEKINNAKDYKPECLAAIIEHCKTMYAFMVDEIKVDIPWYCVEVYLDNSIEAYGKTEAELFAGHPWMKVKCNWNAENDVERDSALVTLTHEYYHCMQRNYRTSVLSCLKYDEATAQLLEDYASKWYLDHDQITTPGTRGEYRNSYELYAFKIPVKSNH